MRTNHRTLKCESLENRELMAGNVTVTLEANEVIVRGDGQSNQVEVFQLDNGAYRISGLNGTTVNGRGFADRNSSDRDLRIFMGGGDDLVFLGNNLARRAMVMEDLQIDMGTGKDGLAIANVQTTDNQFATVRMGGSENEADILAVHRSTFKTGLSFDMGGGDDQVEFVKTTVNGKLEGRLGAGKDSITLADTFFATSFLDGGDGFDTYTRTRGKAATITGFQKVTTN